MNGEGVDRWMVRGVLVMVMCLLGLTCYLVWRIAMVAYRMEETMASVSQDVKTVTGTAAHIAGQVQGVSDKVERLETRISEAVGTRIETVVERLRGVRPGGEGNAEPTETEQEIDYLLQSVRYSGNRFEREGRTHSAMAFSLWLKAKYALWAEKAKTAEEFIEKVASTSESGKSYYAVVGGERVEMKTYLMLVLKKYREREREP